MSNMKEVSILFDVIHNSAGAGFKFILMVMGIIRLTLLGLLYVIKKSFGSGHKKGGSGHKKGGSRLEYLQAFSRSFSWNNADASIQFDPDSN
ncbi:hypothetical protein V1511DRAFT_510476 [Dipodascopsis uninucleata]